MKMKLIMISLTIVSIVSLKTAKAQSFLPIESGFNSQVRTLFYDTFDSTLYAGGNFWKTGSGENMWHISKWDGTDWDSIGNGLDGNVLTITKYQGDIYAGGTFNSDFDTLGGLSGFAKWTGNDWVPIGMDTISSCCVTTTFVDNNFIYIGGSFTSFAGQSATGIARFDGVNWHYYPPLGSNCSISTIVNYNGELYVGGNFNAGNGKKDIVRYDGTNWLSVGGGFSGINSWVNTFEIYQGKLFVGGYFSFSNGDPGNNIAIWDGLNWSSPGNGLLPSSVYCLKVFQNELYAGGQFNNANSTPVTFIAKWDGNNWFSLGSIFDLTVNAITSNYNNMFLGGGFTLIDNDTMNYITKYTLPVGIEENESIEKETSIQISPNPATNFIDIQSNHGFIDNIQLFDISGKIVLEQKDDEILNCRMDVSSIANGIYFVKVISDKNIYVEKLLIEKL